ncbi:helix-turn-helix transcriptional regulator [Bacillus toyonensis]|uniref:helix-turn-helix transcriptional regulator n=1 Tax=Bacillus toyonensis TaxID=155322 RepID=UPI000B446B11|nr:YafY family protein [Bacillus toyonensis]OTX30485.1 transcriptional regulator [Bacillus thuringiensis serovar malayensis]OUB03022.1 transcriptional regulator [Bacillus thuringiensis serovar shandongiensis]MBX0355168.1 YafY family transcriptional regulator [Bacillus toyonensis]MDM5257230.1 YafY family protein [Bacillus toyonensis]MEC2390564.1 YafY family protein [Bacillus toyonensis]
MNRTDRLLAILIELQRRQTVTAQSLAEKFETSIRTIYRDMDALNESGVPIYSMPGYGYSLMDGYFLPPIQLTPEEAVTLLLGGDYIEKTFTSSFSAHAQSAKEKLEVILPTDQKKKVEGLRGTFRFLSPIFSNQQAEQEKLENQLFLLQEAIQNEQAISFSYRKPRETTKIERTVHPYGLVNISGIWYIVAHCLLRKQIRNFRLDRMDTLQQKQEFFTKPKDFSLQDYQPENNRIVTIHLLFPSHIAHKIIESRYFFIDSYEHKDNGFHVFLKSRNIDEVFQWVLSFGSQVQVLEPKILSEKIRDEAKKMLKL